MEHRYKAVLLDIDGTILPVGRCGVSARVVDCVRRLRAQGVCVIVATGRSAFVLTRQLLGEFEADYYICVNGSLVRDAAGTTLAEKRLSRQQMQWLDDFCAAQDLILGYTFEDGYYIYRGYDVLCAQSSEDLQQPVGEDPSDGWIWDGTAQNRHCKSMPYGALMYGVPDTVDFSAAKTLSIVPFHRGCYDIYRADLDKARSAEELLHRLGISMSQCVAIGDGNNDVPMLRAAGLGIAMGNARTAAKQAADRVTLTSEEDGVAVALEEIFGLK